MRPTIEEHLTGTCRILKEIIEPQLADPHALVVLREVMRNLEQLQRGWAQVLPFLQWDNDRTAALLTLAQPHVTVALGTRLREEPPPVDDVLDVAGVEQRNELLRGLLSEVIGELAPSGDAGEMRRCIVAHLQDRASRNPMRLVPEMPSAGTPEP